MQDKSKEIKFFNNFRQGKEYDVLTPFAYDCIARHFSKLIGNRLSQKLKVIDLGCGTGAFTNRFFQTLKADFFALDISLNAIKIACQKKKYNICYLTGDIEQLGFKDEIFDVVLFSGALHHFLDIEGSLKEGYRVLRKGGCILSYDPNVKNPFMWLYRHQYSPFYSKLGRTANEKLFSAQELLNMIRRVGFVNVSTHCVSGITFSYVESWVGKMLLPIYNILELLLGISPLAKEYGSFIIGYGEKK